MTNPSIYTVGGTVQAGDGIYVPRHADEELLELCRQRVFIYILTSRQMGKSSLMVRTAERLADEDIQSVVIDLTQLGVKLTAEQWHLGLLSIIEEALMLDTDVVSWWQSRNHLGFTQRLTKFFQEVLLVEVTSPVVIFVDEIDTTLSLDFTDDFFAAIRYLYVTRAQNTKFKRLSFVLIGVATPGDLIRDPKRTPFNIGQRLDLTDFSVSEAMPLAEGLGVPGERAKQLLGWVLYWTGGHPYLTQRLCSVISEQGKDNWSDTAVFQVVSSTFFGAMSQQDNNLQFVRDMLTKRAPNQNEVLTVFQEIRLGKRSVVDEEQSITKSHLKLSGVVRRSDDTLVVRNRIYQEIFDADWVENELAQQRPYSQALMAWLAADGKDESRLLRGKALQDALAWSKDKSLGNVDYQFLAASQELDKREIQFALAETEKKAQQIVTDAQKKSKRITSIGLGILSVSILAAIGAVWYTQQLIANAQKATELGQQANSALQVFDINPIDELVSAMEAGQGLQKIVEKGRFSEHYPVTSPLRVLSEMLYDIKERNRIKSVGTAIFSPDGKRIVTASDDNTARIWDSNGKQLAVLKGHKGRSFSGWTIFSPDGKRILNASDDNTVRIWDSNGKQLAVFKGHTDRVYSAVFSPDGKRILTVSDDNTTRIWDSNGKQLAVLKGHTDRVYSAVFSPDGKRILTLSLDNTTRIWDSNGKQLAVLKGHTDWSFRGSDVFSPDGKRILTSSLDNTTRIWDSNGKQLAVLKGHKDRVFSAVFSPNGKRILTASDDNTARIWDSNGKELAVLKGHKDRSFRGRAIFSPDGKRILTASYNDAARIWDSNGKQLAVLKGHTDAFSKATFSPDSKRILTASSDNTARIWDSNGNQLAVLKGHTDRVNSAVFSPDGKRILTASFDNTVRIWDIQVKELAVIKGHVSSVNSAIFSPNGKRILTASSDRTTRIWNTQGKELAVIKGHTDRVNSAVFSPNGKRILTASFDKTARIWNTQGKELAIIKGHASYIYRAIFSGDGKRILTASDDNTARIWDSNGNQLAVLKGHTDDVYSAVFSDDSKRIFTASSDNTARIWDSSGNQLDILKGHTNDVNSVIFSGDGKRILTASDDNTARIWDSNGNQLAVLKGHTDDVNSAIFSADGKRILTASDDNTARIWDSNGNQLAVLKGHTDDVSSAIFSADGKRILTASRDRDSTIRVWRMEELDDLLARGCEWLNDYLVIHAQDLRKLKVCHTPSKLKAAAPYLMKAGEKQAIAGDVEEAVVTFKTALRWNREEKFKFDFEKKAQKFEDKGKAERLVNEGEVLAEDNDIENAVAKFQEALKLDPSLDIKPQIKAKKLAARGLISKANNLVLEKKIKATIAAYNQAQKLDPQAEIDAYAWNRLCRQGSLNESAALVMFACEKAVKLSPDSGYIRDSRGLARALTGDYKGAIDDFEAYITQTNNNEYKTQRQKLVKVLRNGKNPFTEEELKKLRSEQPQY
ncbi:WD-40 repeat-containing protein (plasmid) [Calothrix parasitica NIES-267]|uniref:WD-40 repeat-containing protein n=1 Tax=Calothrix parasitica NIES-267 TaxID=1973488 RepID=A0A1Z4M3A3_9CYAN|nr:WD-40 repeat-containing protein [Calothrix parasitica NIES-267]